MLLPQPEIITSDASLQGWGAHYRDHEAQGCWYFQPHGVVSKILGFRATFQALLVFSPFLTGRSVLLRMDNTVAVNYIQRQDGTKSNTLMKEVHPILDWARIHLADLKTVYVPAVQNQLADNLSKIFILNNKWSLSHKAFSLLTHRWGSPPPHIDLAATPVNNKCPKFLVRAAYPTAIGIDSLHQPWNFRLGYIFPPIPLIARFLVRLRSSTSTVIAVIPFWTRRPWFMTILQLNMDDPLLFPVTPDLLSQQGQFLHPAPEKLQLMAWKLKGRGF